MATTTPTTQSPDRPRRRVHSKEFKAQAIALVSQPGMSFRRVAADLGINEAMLREWSKRAKLDGSDAFRGHGVRTEAEARIAALERENRILREERDILKKATEFFVKDRR